MTKILIIEDEFAISQVLKVYMVKEEFEAIQCFSGMEALNMFKSHEPDLVLLDVMLPGKDGWTILKEIRAISECPVVMLTALADVEYRLEGFDGGADDYIPKPFIADEVVARIKAVLKRASRPTSSRQKYGSLEIDFKGHLVWLHGEEVDLTPRDLAVLLFLAEHANQTFTRDQLIEHVWGWDYEGSERAVDLAIKRLRKALLDWPSSEGEIRTLRGVGYQFHVFE
ncbi:response regulator transcription factor [Lysinibacillus sp. LZ02]|uniref:response regulator transcription factor n=1 Tax=Lysinibacillus sp. LZ02 TaxID=3420668 RepID=UPI003D35B308